MSIPSMLAGRDRPDRPATPEAPNGDQGGMKGGGEPATAKALAVQGSRSGLLAKTRFGRALEGHGARIYVHEGVGGCIVDAMVR